MACACWQGAAVEGGEAYTLRHGGAAWVRGAMSDWGPAVACPGCRGDSKGVWQAGTGVTICTLEISCKETECRGHERKAALFVPVVVRPCSALPSRAGRCGRASTALVGSSRGADV